MTGARFDPPAPAPPQRRKMVVTIDHVKTLGILGIILPSHPLVSLLLTALFFYGFGHTVSRPSPGTHLSSRPFFPSHCGANYSTMNRDNRLLTLKTVAFSAEVHFRRDTSRSDLSWADFAGLCG